MNDMYSTRILSPVRQLCAALMLALVCIAIPAQAGEMDDFDRNRDGTITFDEVMKHLEPSVRKGFDALDRNRDGVLSDKDFDNLREGMQQLEHWLQDLIRPLLPDEPDNEAVEV
ncbi:MAG: hypothetical protein R8K50_02385 [Mariprofundus sp.]